MVLLSLSVRRMEGCIDGDELLRVAMLAALLVARRKIPVFIFEYHRSTRFVTFVEFAPADPKIICAYGVDPCGTLLASVQSPPVFSQGSNAP